jgi:predicted O-methyltransferase YrrM
VTQPDLRISAAELLASADRLLPEYRAAIEPIPPKERGRGIYSSEMFFFYCIVQPLRPRQILESGRARGGSTLTLAHCFPSTRIISIEFDQASPNAQVALKKLSAHRHVECLFGDSRELLPKYLEPGDPILIDGPKEFRALKLALALLRSGKPRVVFLHDMGAGSPARRFLDRRWPGAIFSDDPEFLRRFSSLDDEGRAPRDWRRPRSTTMACLPATLPDSYEKLLAKIVLSRATSLAPRKIGGFVAQLLKRRYC